MEMWAWKEKEALRAHPQKEKISAVDSCNTTDIERKGH